MKKYIICFFLLISFAVEAKEKNLNIYDEPRTMVQREFLGQYSKKFKASDFKGEFVLMVFWSRHCSPCIKEMDNLDSFAQAVALNGITVLPISLEGEWGNWEESREFMDKFKGKNLNSYLDPKGDLAADLGVFRFPHTVLINRKGMEIGRIRGAVEWDDPDVIEYIYKIKAEND